MLNLQEIVNKTVAQRKTIRECLDEGTYHPEIANLYEGLKPADEHDIRQTLNSLSLAELLIKSGTTGVSGATYLVPQKLHDTLIFKAQQYDICPLIGYMVNGWEGGDLKLGVAIDGTYVPRAFSSGGKLPELNPQFVSPPTLSPVGYGVNILAGEDMIEDQQYGLVQWCVEQAGKVCGEQASNLAVKVLIDAPDGDGSQGSSLTGNATETKFTSGTTSDILTAFRYIGYFGNFKANTLLALPEAWGHSISAQAVATGWNVTPSTQNYDYKIGILDVLVRTCSTLMSTVGTTLATTKCITLVFDRNNALLTGRKRWLEIKDYSDPINDIAGAVVSYRQDSVTLYKDSIYKLTET
jgi:hypothetical protein